MVYDSRFTDQPRRIESEKEMEKAEALGAFDFLPQFARLELEIRDPLWYRSMAAELRALASTLDLLSRSDGRPQRYQVYEAYAEIKAANLRLKKPTRSRGST